MIPSVQTGLESSELHNLVKDPSTNLITVIENQRFIPSLKFRVYWLID